MALNRQLARLARILVDSEGIGFPEAEARLKKLTLEIVVGEDATSPAAHAAVLTAVSVGRRSFVGGVRVVGSTAQLVNSALPIKAETLADAAAVIGATDFEGAASRRVLVGGVPYSEEWAVAVWCDGWRAGVSMAGEAEWGDGTNPLAGNAAGALAVGVAFQASRGLQVEASQEVDLWPDKGQEAPAFAEVFLPQSLWLLGLGNLGQAFLWALGSLPYERPEQVELVLVDRDRVTEENWATSVLVHDEVYDALKTKVGEAFCEAKAFKVRRVDRYITAADRLDTGDPRVALSGVDKESARQLMADIGYECIVDVGLGRRAEDFDRYRVNVFDESHRIDTHFKRPDTAQSNHEEAGPGTVDVIPDTDAYRRLEADIGRCGAAEIAGASVAAPYVSAIAASIAVARTISLFSGCSPPRSEVGKVRMIKSRRLVEGTAVVLRSSVHAGRPKSAVGDPICVTS